MGGGIVKYITKDKFNEIVGSQVGSQEVIEKLMSYIGATKLNGYSLRYIYFLDKKCRSKLTVPELPYSAIDEIGAGLYKNEHISREERHKKCEAQIKREQNKCKTL